MALGAGARKLSMAAGVLVWPHGVPSGWQLDGQGTTLPPGVQWHVEHCWSASAGDADGWQFAGV